MTNNTECNRPACKGKVKHLESYHEFEAAVIEVSEVKEISAKIDRFYEEIWDMMIDAGMPYPFAMTDDDDDDVADDFHDWFTAQVIATHIRA